MLTFGSLFSGIGGMDLGLERAGMRCAWQVEIDDYARRVLAKHWPDVRRHDDVRTFPPTDPNEWRCDLIAGGFPCQPVSTAGKRLGTADERWLWPEFARVIRELRPRLVLLENTPGLLTSGFDSVLADLAALGFDAEWSVLSACALGAPHVRRRVFVFAYADSFVGEAWIRLRRADNRQGPIWEGLHCESQAICRRWLETTRDNGGIADGIPTEVDRLRALGNAVVPQVAEWIGRRILEAEGGGAC